ncbi:A/G-specific adenine glycosylase [Maritimibacter fusiformis]|uniref:Adenine DNA glycosylase n=1 Tax=Maritimibacter fusiformis TaxID=2603819 RepID=A0A5D0RAB6_9RHOB|nr:A/G-specific adenine glycosylase [Maritimibacter fusiformis]TYB77825.1 A/G-specific adenine glycosylase [Maritimibacter fusiformis]
MRDGRLSANLLDWYDRHARDLPWRVPPDARRRGVMPDPYAVWLSEIMLQQTTVAAVKGYFHRFLARWPDVTALARAEDGAVMGEWAGLGYYARARNLLKCARVVADDLGGVFPDTLDGLRALPGIGPYTAAAIAAIAFDRPECVVDGNVERVMARLFRIETPLPAAKPEIRSRAEALTPRARPGDHAQAVMDLGATICTPKSPACGLCPWRGSCAALAAGVQSDLPARAPKKPKPVRHGIAYLGRREDGAWLVERRPERGLLGGMLGWPGGDWGEMPQEVPPVNADWRDPGVEVRHTFTHFHLRLGLRIATLPQDIQPKTGEFVTLHPGDLPTVMRKAHDLAKAALDADASG